MGQEAIIRCHCGQLTEKVQLRDNIPVGGLLCHCNICRYVTGAITFSILPLSNAPADTFIQNLVKYSTTRIDRYFCKTCGSHVCEYSYKDSEWHALSGSVDEVIGGSQGILEQYTAHEFVGDTIDGGLSFMFPEIPMYLEHPVGQPITNLKAEIDKMQSSIPNSSLAGDRVDAKCHCGQVDFSILRPKHGAKYTAVLSAARSSRLSSGQPITAWILNVPHSNITWNTNNTTTRFHVPNHARYYDFCTHCGASIFRGNATDNQHKNLDVALGVVRAEDGVLARSLVGWRTEEVEEFDEAVDQGIWRKVVEGIGRLEGT